MSTLEYILIPVIIAYNVSRPFLHKNKIKLSAEAKGWTSVDVSMTFLSLFAISSRYVVRYLDEHLEPQVSGCRITMAGEVAWEEGRYLA
jgi:hypothetical protein